MNITLNEIVGLATIALLVASVCVNERKKSVLIHAISCLASSVYGFSIHANTAGAVDAINFVRSITFAYRQLFSKYAYLILLLMFEGGFIYSCFITWIGPVSLLPAIASIIRTYCLWQVNMFWIRMSAVMSGILFSLYYTYYGSMIISAGYIFLAIIGLIKIIKIDMSKNSKTNKYSS